MDDGCRTHAPTLLLSLSIGNTYNKDTGTPSERGPGGLKVSGACGIGARAKSGSRTSLPGLYPTAPISKLDLYNINIPSYPSTNFLIFLRNAVTSSAMDILYYFHRLSLAECINLVFLNLNISATAIRAFTLRHRPSVDEGLFALIYQSL